MEEDDSSVPSLVERQWDDSSSVHDDNVSRGPVPPRLVRRCDESSSEGSSVPAAFSVDSSSNESYSSLPPALLPAFPSRRTRMEEAPTVPAVIMIRENIIVETVMEGLSNMCDTGPHHLPGDHPELCGLPGAMWLEPVEMPSAARIRGGGLDDVSINYARSFGRSVVESSQPTHIFSLLYACTSASLHYIIFGAG